MVEIALGLSLWILVIATLGLIIYLSAARQRRSSHQGRRAKTEFETRYRAYAPQQRLKALLGVTLQPDEYRSEARRWAVEMLLTDGFSIDSIETMLTEHLRGCSDVALRRFVYDDDADLCSKLAFEILESRLAAATNDGHPPERRRDARVAALLREASYRRRLRRQAVVLALVPAAGICFLISTVFLVRGVDPVQLYWPATAVDRSIGSWLQALFWNGVTFLPSIVIAARVVPVVCARLAKGKSRPVKTILLLRPFGHRRSARTLRYVARRLLGGLGVCVTFADTLLRPGFLGFLVVSAPIASVLYRAPQPTSQTASASLTSELAAYRTAIDMPTSTMVQNLVYWARQFSKEVRESDFRNFDGRLEQWVRDVSYEIDPLSADDMWGRRRSRKLSETFTRFDIVVFHPRANQESPDPAIGEIYVRNAQIWIEERLWSSVLVAAILLWHALTSVVVGVQTSWLPAKQLQRAVLKRRPISVGAAAWFLPLDRLVRIRCRESNWPELVSFAAKSVDLIVVDLTDMRPNVLREILEPGIAPVVCIAHDSDRDRALSMLREDALLHAVVGDRIHSYQELKRDNDGKFVGHCAAELLLTKSEVKKNH